MIVIWMRAAKLAQDIVELQAEVVQKALVGPQVFQLTILPTEA